MSNWFYLTDGQQHGPVEPAALKHLATTCRIAFFLFVVTARHITAQTQPNTGGANSSPAGSAKGLAVPSIESRLAPDPNIDEYLYLVYRLEFLHSQWPSDIENSEKTAGALATLRQEFVRGVEHVKIRKMPEELVKIYSDSVDLIDRYAEFLADSGAIDRNYQQKVVQTSTNGAVGDFTEGMGTGAALAAAGTNPLGATVIIVGFQIKKGFQHYYERKHLDDEKARALQERLNQFLAERSHVIARIQEYVEIFGETRGWGASEVSFDQDEKESTHLLDAIQQGNLKFLFDRVANLKKCDDLAMHSHMQQVPSFVRTSQIGTLTGEATKKRLTCGMMPLTTISTQRG